jgi:hypothetical protein
MGSMDLAKCPKWKGVVPDAVPLDAELQSISLPWTGSALGLADLNFVTGRAKPIIVGVAGPESAGKTTLLAAWYLLLGRALLTDTAWQFGGSYSLEGWEAVAAALRWTPGQSPGFPPHTSSRGARAPGLLHIAFRHESHQLRDFLFADAPGEWFQRWAVDEDAEDAEGARWISQHADVLLLVADRQALSGPRMGSARSAFQLLASRVAAQRRGRPVALVWTKADVEVAPEMESRIRQTVTSVMPDAAEFSVSVLSGNSGTTGVGFQEIFRWVLGSRRPAVQIPQAAASGNDPLFVFGRR